MFPKFDDPLSQKVSPWIWKGNWNSSYSLWRRREDWSVMERPITLEWAEADDSERPIANAKVEGGHQDLPVYCNL